MLEPCRVADRNPDPTEFRGARKTTNVMKLIGRVSWRKLHSSLCGEKIIRNIR